MISDSIGNGLMLIAHDIGDRIVLGLVTCDVVQGLDNSSCSLILEILIILALEMRHWLSVVGWLLMQPLNLIEIIVGHHNINSSHCVYLRCLVRNLSKFLFRSQIVTISLAMLSRRCQTIKLVSSGWFQSFIIIIFVRWWIGIWFFSNRELYLFYILLNLLSQHRFDRLIKSMLLAER